MKKTIKIGDLTCLCSTPVSNSKIAYILYPMDILNDWIESAAEKYGATIVVITGMDWQNVFSPWEAPGVPKGDPDFKGESPEFLKLLQENVIPVIENSLHIADNPERNLVGVSMSGLFALWQWMECDTFRSIASLSGSFWYEGFINWMEKIKIPPKSGMGFFLLGDKESKSNVREFNTVGVNTDTIVSLLKSAGIKVVFRSVPGNHFSDAVPRLEMAFNALYSSSYQN
ncbi:MAG: hypothetical protein K2J82_11555 [Muribaculaceae bacterium]|nr:hypothetical protein [Muribaculaceae bacterium]MDE6755232.1 hypothetical protein [Muribaculaceae bacterium]